MIKETISNIAVIHEKKKIRITNTMKNVYIAKQKRA